MTHQKRWRAIRLLLIAVCFALARPAAAGAPGRLQAGLIHSEIGTGVLDTKGVCTRPERDDAVALAVHRHVRDKLLVGQ